MNRWENEVNRIIGFLIEIQYYPLYSEKFANHASSVSLWLEDILLKARTKILLLLVKYLPASDLNLQILEKEVSEWNDDYLMNLFEQLRMQVLKSVIISQGDNGLKATSIG